MLNNKIKELWKTKQLSKQKGIKNVEKVWNTKTIVLS